MQFVPGGLDAVEAGIMRGLSVGLNFLDNPPVTWEMGEGTRDPEAATNSPMRRCGLWKCHDSSPPPVHGRLDYADQAHE